MRKTTCIASAARVAQELPVKRSRWCLPMNLACCATSNAFYGAAFRRCRLRCSRSLSPPRRRLLVRAVLRKGLADTAVKIIMLVVDAGMAIPSVAIRAVRRVQVRVRTQALARAPDRVAVREVSVSRSEADSAKAVLESGRADSARILGPSSDASNRTRRSLASIRAYCRNRSVYPRTRRSTRVLAA